MKPKGKSSTCPIYSGKELPKPISDEGEAAIELNCAAGVTKVAEVVFVQPFEVDEKLAEQVKGKVVVLDVAFCADTPRSSFATTTLPFINALGERLVLWVDHHEHERHEDFADDPRFILVSRKQHPAVPEMITPDLVQRVGQVDTIVAHGDFDGIMAAAKWVLGGEEPYRGADEDARAIDSRIGEPSELGQKIEWALKVDPADDEFRQTVLEYLVSRCQNEEAWAKIEERARNYEAIRARTNYWAERFTIEDGIAIVDIRGERERVDLTELLLAGERKAPLQIAIVRNRNLTTGETQLVIAAPVNSGYDFPKMFGLGGGMPTRVTLPDERFWEAMAKLKGKTNPPEVKPPCFILYADVDRVKEYLFGSVRLRHIVAASSLLAHINEKETQWLIQAHDGRLVFSAGGITQAVFSDKDKALKAGWELRQLYAERTGTASITITVVPWKGDQTFTDALENARREMSRRKAGLEGEEERGSEWFVGRAAFFSGSPFFRVCELTGREFAVKWEQQPDGAFRNFGIAIRQTEVWRESQRRQKSDSFDPDLGDRLEVDGLIRQKLAARLKDDPRQWKFPEDFEELSRDSRPRGYIGFIEADGNRFGEILKALSKSLEGKSPEQQFAAYEAFSKLLKETTREALIDAVVEVLSDAFEKGQKEKLIPLRVLILGGDDVMLVVQAQYALHLADLFCRKFQKLAEKRKGQSILKDIPLPAFTMSVGVVIAHHNIPFLSLHRMASELLKNAKRRSWAAWRCGVETGSVDFQVVTGSNIEDLKTVRSEIYAIYEDGVELLLTGRPYLVSPQEGEDELDKLLCLVEELKRVGMPRSQLKQLAEIIHMGRVQGNVRFMRWFLRLGGEGENVLKKTIRKALEQSGVEIPTLWQEDKRIGGSGKLYCPLMDVIELFDLWQIRG